MLVRANSFISSTFGMYRSRHQVDARAIAANTITYQCNKGCGQEIYFDSNSKGQSDKWITLEKETELPLGCYQIKIGEPLSY